MGFWRQYICGCGVRCSINGLARASHERGKVHNAWLVRTSVGKLKLNEAGYAVDVETLENSPSKVLTSPAAESKIDTAREVKEGR